MSEGEDEYENQDYIGQDQYENQDEVGQDQYEEQNEVGKEENNSEKTSKKKEINSQKKEESKGIKTKSKLTNHINNLTQKDNRKIPKIKLKKNTSSIISCSKSSAIKKKNESKINIYNFSLIKKSKT